MRTCPRPPCRLPQDLLAGGPGPALPAGRHAGLVPLFPALAFRPSRDRTPQRDGPCGIIACSCLPSCPAAVLQRVPSLMQGARERDTARALSPYASPLPGPIHGQRPRPRVAWMLQPRLFRSPPCKLWVVSAISSGFSPSVWAPACSGASRACSASSASSASPGAGPASSWPVSPSCPSAACPSPVTSSPVKATSAPVRWARWATSSGYCSAASGSPAAICSRPWPAP